MSPNDRPRTGMMPGQSLARFRICGYTEARKNTNAMTAGPRVGSAAMMSLLLPSAAGVKYTIMQTLGRRGVQVHGMCVVDGEVGVDVRMAAPLVLAYKIGSILFEMKQIWKHMVQHRVCVAFHY